MAYNINITNGSGTENILNGNYSVTSTTTGYDNSSITPSTVDVVEGTNEYAFTISATGTLTLHVSENGTAEGTAIENAKFVRTDSSGNEYGTEVTSNNLGNAVFLNVPWDDQNAPIIYFKQTASDGMHEFDTTVQTATLNQQTGTVEITNTLAAQRTIAFTDANYSGLGVTGQISLN